MDISELLTKPYSTEEAARQTAGPFGGRRCCPSQCSAEGKVLIMPARIYILLLNLYIYEGLPNSVLPNQLSFTLC